MVIATVFTTELIAILGALVAVLGIAVCAVVSNNERTQGALVAVAATLMGGIVGGGFATLAADSSGESAANEVKGQVSTQVSNATQKAASSVTKTLSDEIAKNGGR